MRDKHRLRFTWETTRTEGTAHDIAHTTTSTTAYCTTTIDISTRHHGVSSRLHNYDSFCSQPLQTADRLTQSEVATKLRFRFESSLHVLTWVGNAGRCIVGPRLTWVGDAWRDAVSPRLTRVGCACRADDLAGAVFPFRGLTHVEAPIPDGRHGSSVNEVPTSKRDAGLLRSYDGFYNAPISKC
jgi:hypothetical protein